MQTFEERSIHPSKVIPLARAIVWPRPLTCLHGWGRSRPRVVAVRVSRSLFRISGLVMFVVRPVGRSASRVGRF